MIYLINPEVKARSTYTAYEKPEEAAKFTYLPEPVGQKMPYTCSLKEDSPYWTVVILGISFHKFSHTAIKSHDDFPVPVLAVFYLAKNQKKAIELKAAKKILTWRKKQEGENGYHLVTARKPASNFIEIKALPAGEYGDFVKYEDLAKLPFASAEAMSLSEKEAFAAKLRKEIEDERQAIKKQERRGKNG